MLIKAGKALNETKMEVRVQFKTQAGFFAEKAAAEGMRNEFVMTLKPKDAMYLKLVMKKPGLNMDMTMSELNLTYNERCDAGRRCLECGGVGWGGVDAVIRHFPFQDIGRCAGSRSTFQRRTRGSSLMLCSATSSISCGGMN